MDTNTEIAVARAVGIGELKFFSKTHYGGGAACATIQHAAMAVATGVADVVVAYRAFNERSGMRFGQVQTRLVGDAGAQADSTAADNSFSYPHGLSTPAAQVAMIAQRYMHLSGATSRDFGAISVADRKHAAKNPKAYFYEKPITIEDHQNSRWIAEPLRLLDCCQETDGAVAIVVTSRGAGAGPQAAAGDHRGGVAGLQPRPVHDGQLLPAGTGPARDGPGGSAAMAAVRVSSRPTSRPRCSTTTSPRSP